MEVLENISGPLTVVAIVGTQRGGKSSLLNMLFNRQMEGFGLGHYMDPQTDGLWMWIREHPQKPGLRVMYLDTEGLDAPMVAPFYNWTLSALTLLICDLYIYQSKGSIDSAAADRLDTILRVAEHLKGGGADQGEDAANSRPSFLWLLRDHHLQMRSEPREEMLEKMDVSAQRTLRRCFADYDCMPLPRPLDEDDKLRSLDTLTFGDLKDSFREEFAILERSLRRRLARPRVLGGTEVTGDIVASLIRRYTSSIANRSGLIKEIAHMPTQRQMLVQMAGERAIRAGVEAYRAHVKSSGVRGRFPILTHDLQEVHEEAAAAARAAFEDGAIADAEETEHYRAGLERKLGSWDEVPGVRWEEPSEQNWAPLSGDQGWEGGDKGCGSPAAARRRELVGGELATLWQANMTQSVSACDGRIASLHQPLATRIRATVAAAGRETAGLGCARGATLAVPDAVAGRVFAGRGSPTSAANGLGTASTDGAPASAAERPDVDGAAFEDLAAFDRAVAEVCSTVAGEASSLGPAVPRAIKVYRSACAGARVELARALAVQSAASSGLQGVQALAERVQGMQGHVLESLAKQSQEERDALKRHADTVAETARSELAEQRRWAEGEHEAVRDAVRSAEAESEKRAKSLSDEMEGGLRSARDSAKQWAQEAQDSARREASAALETATRTLEQRCDALGRESRDGVEAVRKEARTRAEEVERGVRARVEQVDGRITSVASGLETRIGQAEAAVREVGEERRAALGDAERRLTQRAEEAEAAAQEVQRKAREEQAELGTGLRASLAELENRMQAMEQRHSEEMQRHGEESAAAVEAERKAREEEVAAVRREAQAALDEARASWQQSLQEALESERAEMERQVEVAREEGRDAAQEVERDMKRAVSEVVASERSVLEEEVARVEREGREAVDKAVEEAVGAEREAREKEVTRVEREGREAVDKAVEEAVGAEREAREKEVAQLHSASEQARSKAQTVDRVADSLDKAVADVTAVYTRVGDLGSRLESLEAAGAQQRQLLLGEDLSCGEHDAQAMRSKIQDTLGIAAMHARLEEAEQSGREQATQELADLSQSVTELSAALEQQRAEVGALETHLKRLADGQEGAEARVQRVEEEQQSLAGRVQTAETQAAEAAECAKGRMRPVEEKADRADKAIAQLSRDLQALRATVEGSDGLQEHMRMVKERLPEASASAALETRVTRVAEALRAAGGQVREVQERLQSLAREQQGLHEAISSVKGGVKDEQAALWESVSTVSCRISDMQKFIDDLR